MRAAEAGPLLAIDTGSPRPSVAVGSGGALLAEAWGEIERSSVNLLSLVDRALTTAGVRPTDLAGLVALRGPGSFTGLRVGLATTLGLHQALGLPAVGVPTLEILAALGPGDGSGLVAVVDALRGEWFAQPFRSAEPPTAAGEPRLLTAAGLRRLAPALAIGFGAGGIAELDEAGIRTLEPPPLAGVAARQLGRFPVPWDPASLVEPLYLRPPSARPPTRARTGPA